jgi:hypothetical protein
MSLWFYLEGPAQTVDCECERFGHSHKATKQDSSFDRNITHNLHAMFNEAGVGDILWHGDGQVAGDVLPKLEAARVLMQKEPTRFEAFNAKNGWGMYEHALSFLNDVIRGCENNPTHTIRCSR